jgi:hypothetical protein
MTRAIRAGRWCFGAAVAALATAWAPARADITVDFTLATTPTIQVSFDSITNMTFVSETYNVTNPMAFPSPAGQTGGLTIDLRLPANMEIVVGASGVTADVDADWFQSDGSRLVNDSATAAYTLLAAPGSTAPAAIAASVTINAYGSPPSTPGFVTTSTSFVQAGSYAVTGAELVDPGFVDRLNAALTGGANSIAFELARLRFFFVLPGDVAPGDIAPRTHVAMISAPEPSSLALFGLGGVGLACRAVRRRRGRRA